MASSTPSAPITSSRGAADTTAGRIYFSTPSAQVRDPVGDLVFTPPPTSAHTILLGEKLSGGGKTIPGGRSWAKNSKKNSQCPKLSHRAEKKPYSKSLYIEPNYALSLYIEPNYTLSLNIEPNYTLS